MNAAVGGGFVARHAVRNVMTGQLQLLDVPDIDAAERQVLCARVRVRASASEQPRRRSCWTPRPS